MRPTLPLALALVLLVSAGDAQLTAGGTEPGDDDPRIYPDEVIAPEMDSRDPAWKPVYASFEDPASLQCGGRWACEEYKAAEIAKTQNGTAPK